MVGIEAGSAREGGLTLREVAELVDGEVRGDPDARVRGVSSLDEADATALALFADRRYARHLRDSGAGAVLVSAELADAVAEGRAAVVVEDAHAALVPLLERFHPVVEPERVVHPTAVVARGASLGAGVRVGPYAVIDEGVQLGDRVVVGAHAVIGRGARVGDDSVIHPHVVVYHGCVLGHRVEVHAGARIGSDGFGYAMREGRYAKIPQVGVCVLDDDVEVGANACIDRGSIGDTRVGAGTKIDNLVHLGHNVRVGQGCAMAAQVGIAGSTRVGSGVVFGGQAGMVGHIEIGDGARISAQAGVIGDVAAGDSVTGYPARGLRRYLRAAALMMKLPELVARVARLEAGGSGPGRPDSRTSTVEPEGT